VLVAVGPGQREAGDPEQLVAPAAVPVALTGCHPHRLAGDRQALGDQRQRAGRAGQGLSAQVGEADRGAPRVDVDGEADVAGQLHRGGVGVGHGPGTAVDEQHGHRDVGQHAGQRGRRGAGAGALGEDGGGGADDAGFLTAHDPVGTLEEGLVPRSVPLGRHGHDSNHAISRPVTTGFPV
jgi:hypothetical protein